MSINYSGLRRLEHADRTAERLRALRDGSLAEVRAARSEGSFLLATWNIRDFDNNKFRWGPRLPETFYYLAEVISCFDMVAIQEVNDEIEPFERLMGVLGRNEWDYLLTDLTEGTSGNGERMAFVFRRSKVWFRRIAGEVVLPEGQLIVAADTSGTAPVPVNDDGTSPARHQFARSPYLVCFQSGWFRFALCTVHIYYGAESGAALERRIAEIEALVEFFARRQDKEVAAARKRARADAERYGRPLPPPGAPNPDVENYILLGDFNVVSPEHRTMEALTSHGFSVPEQIGPEAIQGRDHFYDQIAVRVKDPRFRVVRGGVVPVFADVFRDEDEVVYREQVPVRDREPDPSFRASGRQGRYDKWRTWQMSDHSPLWIQIETDFADQYLEELGTP